MHVDEVSPTPMLRQVRGSEKIADVLRTVAFPITKADLMVKLRGATLDFGDASAALSEIVRGVPQDRFRDADQAHREVNTRWLRITKSLAVVEQQENADR